MEQFDDRIDLYINKAQPFARPILEYIREVVHEAAPQICETMKWSSPFFDYKGLVCHMMAFKQHCGFGFWKAGLLGLETPPDGESSAGSFGRITKIEDLPAREVLIDLIQKAIALNENEVKAPPRNAKAPAKPAGMLVIPDYFLEALSKNIVARENFDNFSPSQKKEYAEWLIDAKAVATREKRMEQAIEWISEGKSRHWKYQSK